MVTTKTIRDTTGKAYVAVFVNGKEVKNVSELVMTTNETVLDKVI